jgi:hypothetical protein
MHDDLVETILVVGTVGLKQSQINIPEQIAVLEKAVKQKYIYVNPRGEYKLTLKGQKAFKDAKRDWVAEIGYIPTGEKVDVSLEELADIVGKKRWW